MRRIRHPIRRAHTTQPGQRRARWRVARAALTTTAAIQGALRNRRFLLLAAVATGLLAGCAGEGIDPVTNSNSYSTLTNWNTCGQADLNGGSNCFSDLVNKAGGNSNIWIRNGTSVNSWICGTSPWPGDANLTSNAGQELNAGYNVVVVFSGNNGNIPSQSQWQCAVKWMIQMFPNDGYSMNGQLYVESWNEPDCSCGGSNGINSFTAAQLFQATQAGVSQAGVGNTQAVAGVFSGSGSGTPTSSCDYNGEGAGSSLYMNSYACYLADHGDSSAFTDHWSFHDYEDTDSNPNCNYDGNFSDCSSAGLNRDEQTIEDMAAVYSENDPPFMITETGCANWPVGAQGCHNNTASRQQLAGAAFEYEWLAESVPTIWYESQGDENPTWDSGLLNGGGGPRVNWCVLDGYSYSQAVNSPNCQSAS
jgi:hypothetical protein